MFIISQLDSEHLKAKVIYLVNDIIRLWAECTNTISDEYIDDMSKRVLGGTSSLTTLLEMGAGESAKLHQNGL